MTVTAGLPRPPQPTPADMFPDTPMLLPLGTSYVYCPHCGNRLNGLLAGCDRRTCLTAELDHDRAFERRLDS